MDGKPLIDLPEEAFSRSAALLGDAAMAALAAAPILVVGVGGVGGWCAEALARTGARHLTLVDDDVVAPSNLNRQDCATVALLGVAKTEAMKARLLSIAPAAKIEPLRARWPETGAGPVDLRNFACVVDAIDSIGSKAALIEAACAAGVPIVSSMGAARRKDPGAVRTSRFKKVEGDAIARALRRRFRKAGGGIPEFLCVHSSEPPAEIESLGSLMCVVAVFGMHLAAQAINLATGGVK